MTAAEGTPKNIYGWNGDSHVGYMGEALKNCRQYIATNENNNDSFLSFFQDANAVCLSAMLEFTSRTDNSQMQNVFELAYPSVPWDAHRISWDTAPAFTPSGQLGSAPGKDGKIEFDITDVLNQWIKGQRLQAGFMLLPLQRTRPSSDRH